MQTNVLLQHNTHGLDCRCQWSLCSPMKPPSTVLSIGFFISLLALWTVTRITQAWFTPFWGCFPSSTSKSLPQANSKGFYITWSGNATATTALSCHQDVLVTSSPLRHTQLRGGKVYWPSVCRGFSHSSQAPKPDGRGEGNGRGQRTHDTAIHDLSNALL